MYYLSDRSLAELEGVHPKLAAVVKRAIELTRQDFTVVDGLRTLAEQRDLYERGASKTMNSRHLRQPDGYGHAVDLVPYHDGRPRWEWSLIYPVAAAMHRAAREVQLPLRWGGVWDRKFLELPHDPAGLRQAVETYIRRHPGPDFIDGPHYEILD